MDHLSSNFQGPIGPALERELCLIELLLDDIGLGILRKRSASHPAVRRYDTIRAFIDNNAHVNYPDEMDLVLQVGSTLLDALRPGTSPEETIGAIDDQEVLQQLRLRVLDPQQFNDQFAALSCWDLLHTNGICANLVEKNGMPDICITLSDNGKEWVEVKRIRTGTDPQRARHVIQKANSQLKRADAKGAGSVYLSIERPQKTLAFDDSIPQEIQSYVSEVNRELGCGCSKSVHTVIVAWDDYLLFADSPESTCYYVRRRSVVLNHRAPRQTSKVPAHAFNLSRIVALPLKVNWSGGVEDKRRLTAIKAGNITVTELFRTECERPGYVRATHALGALQNPDSVARYELGDAAMILVTRKITLARHPYTLLLIVSAPDTERLDIILGYRLYTADLATPSSHPFDLFMAFLQRYGCPVTAGGYHGLLIPNVVVSGSQGDDTQIVRADPPTGEEAGFVFAKIKLLSTMPPKVHVNWAFGILMQRYKRDLKKQLR